MKKLSAQNRADLKKVFDEIGVDKLKSWIEAVADGETRKVKRRGKLVEEVVRSANPGRAAELMLGLAEYVKPKLARVEQTGAGGGPLRVIVQQQVARAGSAAVDVKLKTKEEP
jgi:hypothetical protein